MAITEEQKLAIDNYGQRISTLKDFVAACRKRPGHMIGPLGGPGLLNMIREIFQNAIDQMMEPESPCNWFSLQYDERTLEVIVEDNGMGFPFDDILRIFTKEYTSKNYEKQPFHYSSGLHGVGAKVVNALSTYMCVESYRYDGKAIKIEFQQGYPIGKPVEIKNPEKKQGARVLFIPDPEIMGDMDLPWTDVYNLIKQIISITFPGAHMDFVGIDKKGKVHTESIVNEDGIITDLIMKTSKPLVKPIVVSADDGYHKLDAAFCIDSEFPETRITSFSNFCPTKEGTHIQGTVEGIAKWFTDYMNNIYLTNQKTKNKIKVIANDIKVGLNVMISAAHLEPVFTGQAKEILSNADMIKFCKDTVIAGLNEWSKSNPLDLSKMCQYFKDIAEVRLKQDTERIKIVAKYQKNALTDLPLKYARPSETCKELFLVEGDSAGGTVKVARDVKTQGCFALRGKISSAFEKSKQEFWENAEIQGIARIILNKDYVRNFDPVNDVKWEKIIFMADADVDKLVV